MVRWTKALVIAIRIKEKRISVAASTTDALKYVRNVL